MIVFLKTLLVLTMAGTLCGLFLVALRKLSMGKVPSTFLYFAWLVVLLRFAVPVNGLVPVGKPAPHVASPMPVYTESHPIDAETEITVVPFDYSYSDTPVQTVQSQPATYQTASAETTAVQKSLSVPTILFAVWCCGTAVFLLWNVIPYIRFSKALWSALSMPSEDDIRLYEDLSGKRKPSLARSDLISTPLTFGLFRHIIVIPDIEYDADALRIILSHEIVHYRRHDILIKWIAMLVFSMHWFNPFTWYFRRELETVCELSCDEKLLKGMDRNEKRSYGDALISIAENACKTKCEMTTGFSGGKKDLKERLIQIMSFKKKSKVAVAVALIPVLILCGCAAVLGPKTEKSSEAGVVSVSDVDELLEAIAPDTEIHLAAGTYNLTEAANYGKDGAGNYNWISYGFENQYGLCIEDIDNLTLIGDDAEILTVPRSANVLAFRKCDQLTLQGLTVGHTEAAEACEGSVIGLESCVDTTIDNCSLYGCGTIGVWAEGCGNLKVSDTDIYHCSSAGISYQYATGLAVDGCRIYDCGKPEKYQGAAAAFIFFDARDIVLRNCDIHDNFLQTFLQGNAKELTFEDTRIHDNHISSLFHYDGDARFKDTAFEGNSVDKWMAEGQTGTILIDGKQATEEELTSMWGNQMSSAGIGAAEADYQPIDRTGAKEVHIKTADEFLSAIASDTTVYIDVPQIDLTSASGYGEGATKEYLLPEFGDKAYAWVYCFDGYELYIGNVSNFHIVGGEIVTQPRYANVLNYLNCGNVTLDGVHLGHTPEQGTCSGGVLFFENTDVIILEGCDLYGCGILGITTRNVNNIHVQNTLIHDCSYGAAVLEDTNEAVFLGCDVVNCPDPHFSLRGCTDFSWDNKLMDPHSTFNVNDDARNPFEEALNSASVPTPMPETGSEKSGAVTVACMVVDAYAKGYEDFDLTIRSYLSRTSAIGVSGEITACDFPVYYETTEGLISAKEIFPAQMIQICRMDGADEITDDEPEGTTRTIYIYFRTSTDHPERESSYFIVDLIVEDGCWRVVRF